MTNEPDFTDTWMNPSSSASWISKPDDGKTHYLIERERRVPVSGNRAYITQWDFWSQHDTSEERDTALNRLRKEHPIWSLRKRDSHPWDRR